MARSQQPVESPGPFETEDSDDRLDSFQMNLAKMNAITYAPGYLLKRCFEKHECQIWLTDPELNNSAYNFFCFFKAYKSTTKPFGGLVVPGNDFVGNVTKMESLFVKELPGVISMAGIGKYLTSKVSQFTLPQRSGFPGEYLVKLFIRMRLYYAVKFANQEFLTPGMKSKIILRLHVCSCPRIIK